MLQSFRLEETGNERSLMDFGDLNIIILLLLWTYGVWKAAHWYIRFKVWYSNYFGTSTTDQAATPEEAVELDRELLQQVLVLDPATLFDPPRSTTSNLFEPPAPPPIRHNQRDKQTQSQVRYTWHHAHPRFTPLGVVNHGAWYGSGARCPQNDY